MAEPAKKGGGLMALMMGGDDEAADPLDEKTRALKDMFSAGKRGDWEGAAHAFQEAYDICAGRTVDAEEDEDEDLELEEE